MAARAGVHATVEPPFCFFPTPSSPSANRSARPALASSSGGSAFGPPGARPRRPCAGLGGRSWAARQSSPLSWPWVPLPLPGLSGCPPSLRAWRGSCRQVSFVLPMSVGLAGLASLGPPPSRGRSGSSALSFAGAKRPCAGHACGSRREPLAGPQCAVLSGPRLRWLRPVLRPICGFWVFGSALL
jgi:hypothetical protein